MTAHNAFAWFLACTGDYRDRARWHMEQTQRRKSFMPWCYLSDDPQMVFMQTCVALGLR